MRAKSYIQYKDAKTGEVKILTLWIQNLELSRVEDGYIKLKLATNEDGSSRITTNNSGIEQYSFNELVKNGAYVFVSVDDAKIIKALGLGVVIDNDIWIRIPVHTSVPDFLFNTSPKWK